MNITKDFRTFAKDHHVSMSVYDDIVKKTNESGWSWDFKLNIWKFNGSISNESPTNYWEESQAITDKYTCCLSGYSKECDHIMCPTY